MSQVDDWSDGYTSDYLRDLNTYGPASANVPRSSVVSHQVRYRAPDTSDIPLAPGQNPEDSVYSNAPGARMGQLKPRSGYNPPAGGGYTASTFPSSGAGARRYARPKPVAKKKTQSASKQQTQSASKQQPQPEYRTGGARTPEENEITRSAAEHRTGADLGELSSQALDAAARFLPALKLLGFGAGAGSADTASTDRPSYMGAAGTMADNFARTLPQPSAASRQTAPESSSTEGQFENMPWYKDAKAHHEAVEKNMDDYGSVLGTLKSTWDDIPWWTKLVMLPPVFKAGSPAAGASTTGNVWVEGGRAAAGDATAGAKAFEETLSRMNGGAARGAPTEAFAQPAASASASWRTGRIAEYPAGTGKFDQFGGLGESGRSAVGTGSAPASDGAAKLGEQTVSYKDSVARLADAGTETAGREAAGADATAGAAARQGAGDAAGGAAARQGAGEAAGALAPQLQKDLLAVRQKVSSEGDSFERIRDVLRISGGRQELLPANIREACEPLRRIMEQGGGAALTPAEREAVQLYMNRPVASGAAGAAGANGAAGAGRAGEAAGTAARQGAGEAAGTLSNYERQLYNAYINRVQDDPGLVDLVPSTLHRVVGNAARSIDSLSDAELSAFYKALNDAVDSRQIASLFVGGL